MCKGYDAGNIGGKLFEYVFCNCHKKSMMTWLYFCIRRKSLQEDDEPCGSN